MNLNYIIAFGSGLAVGMLYAAARAGLARMTVEAMRSENRALVARNAELRRDKGKLAEALDQARAELREGSPASEGAVRTDYLN